MAIRVILADDHAVVRNGLQLLLEIQPDIQVIGEAENGRAAVRYAQILQPDVVVMDIAMADMNGIEATRQIRASAPATQVVILSMYSTEEHIVRAFKAGALGYVIKESAGNDVVAALRAVCAGQSYISGKITMSILATGGIEHRQSPLDRLSSREREVLQLLVEGKSSAEIADILALSPKTIETYRSRLMQKLGINNIPGLVKFALQHGLTPP